MALTAWPVHSSSSVRPLQALRTEAALRAEAPGAGQQAGDGDLEGAWILTWSHAPGVSSVFGRCSGGVESGTGVVGWSWWVCVRTRVSFAR